MVLANNIMLKLVQRVPKYWNNFLWCDVCMQLIISRGDLWGDEIPRTKELVTSETAALPDTVPHEANALHCFLCENSIEQKHIANNNERWPQNDVRQKREELVPEKTTSICSICRRPPGSLSDLFSIPVLCRSFMACYTLFLELRSETLAEKKKIFVSRRRRLLRPHVPFSARPLFLFFLISSTISPTLRLYHGMVCVCVLHSSDLLLTILCANM